MLRPILLSLALGPGTDPIAVYNGRSGNLDVRPLRDEAAVVVDGALDEAVWGRAAILTGFSQFSPVDGVAAVDSTEVLVWYSPTAIYFGIRAFEAHGAVHATLADRDKIGADDHIQILLSTFNDARQATVFAVNPLRRAVGRRAGGDRRDPRRQRIQQRGGEAGDRGPEPGLRLRLQGTAHRLRLRGRSPDPVQEPALPIGGGAELGSQRDPAGAALRLRGLLDAGAPRERLVPGAVGSSGGPDRPPSRAGGRLHAFGHLAHHRPPGRTTERGTTAAAPRSWAARSAGASPTT